MARLISVLCGLALCTMLAPTQAAQREGDAIVFKVPALADAARHLKLLEYPAYLALALENNGFSPSHSSRLTIRDRRGFEIRNASVRFVDSKGDKYRYEAALKLPIGGSDTSLRVPVEVDVSSLASGTIVLRVFVPMSSLLPADLLERIEFKVRSLANEAAQRQMLRYLDEIGTRQKAGPATEVVLEAILLEAYNRGAPAAPERPDTGNAEPLHEQYALIATLAIWLVLVPLLILGRIWYRARRTRGSRDPAA